MNAIQISSRALLLGSAAVAGVTQTAPVYAQVEEAEPRTESPTGSPNNEGVSSADTTAVTTREDDAAADNVIIVTAQKRSESLQDVPASVSVLTGDQLENLHATSLSEYATYIPGLTVGSEGSPGQTSVSLRGVSSQLGGGGATVGTYIGDLPLGPSSAYAQGARFALDLLPYDIDRIEVLRGPQGTLYGASSMGGLLKYALRPADLDELEFRAGGEIFDIKGSDDLGWGLRATANLPIVSGIAAARVSAFKQRTPGYIDAYTFAALDPVTGEPTGFVRRSSDINDVDQQGGRAAFQLAITPDVNLKLDAIIQETRSNANSSMSVDRSDLDPLVADRAALKFRPEPFDSDIIFVGATLNADLDFATFTSATSLSTYDIEQGVDATVPLRPLFGGAVSDLTTAIDVEKFTQEVRLASPTGGAIEWLVGAFYTTEYSTYRQNVELIGPDGEPAATAITVDIPTSFDEFAIFGDLTLRPIERFDITGGIRLAHNNQKFTQVLEIVGGPPPFVTSGKSDEDVITWMLNARYHLSPDVMFYGRVATGYRPGGPNVVFPGFESPSTFDADTLTNYEAGVKGRFLDRRLDVELSLYRIDWKDIQISVPIGPFGGIGNANEAKVEGLEFSALLRPFTGTRLGVTAAYTDSTLSEDDPALGEEGTRLPFTAKWSGAVTADHEFALGNGWDARVGAGLRHVGKRTAPFFLTPAERDLDGLKLPAYTLLDLTAAVSQGPWEVSVFVRNLTDKRAYLGVTDFVRFGTAYADLVVNQPRTVGLSLDTRF